MTQVQTLNYFKLLIVLVFGKKEIILFDCLPQDRKVMYCA